MGRDLLGLCLKDEEDGEDGGDGGDGGGDGTGNGKQQAEHCSDFFSFLLFFLVQSEPTKLCEVPLVSSATLSVVVERRR